MSEDGVRVRVSVRVRENKKSKESQQDGALLAQTNRGSSIKA